MHPLNPKKFFGPTGMAVTYYNGSSTVTGYVSKQRSPNKFDITDGTHLKQELILAPNTTIASAINSSNSAYFTIPIYPNNKVASGASFTVHYGISTAALVATGSGYVVNDVLTLAGTGSATITVNTVNGSGNIETFTVTTVGTVTALPANPVAVTGGTGTGATFSLTWKVISVTASGGSNYVVGEELLFNGLVTTGLEPVAYIATVSSGAISTVTISNDGSLITTAAKSISVSASPEYVQKINEFKVLTTEGNDYQWSLGTSVESDAVIPTFEG